MLVLVHPVAGTQVSVVQTEESLQRTAASKGVKTHPVAGLQESSVQALLSLQTRAVWTHWSVARLQLSMIHWLLELHGFGVALQRPLLLQTLIWQGIGGQTTLLTMQRSQKTGVGTQFPSAGLQLKLLHGSGGLGVQSTGV